MAYRDSDISDNKENRRIFPYRRPPGPGMSSLLKISPKSTAPIGRAAKEFFEKGGRTQRVEAIVPRQSRFLRWTLLKKGRLAGVSKAILTPERLRRGWSSICHRPWWWRKELGARWFVRRLARRAMRVLAPCRCSYSATEEQKQKYLPRLFIGGAGCRRTASPNLMPGPIHWPRKTPRRPSHPMAATMCFNGQKMWITNGGKGGPVHSLRQDQRRSVFPRSSSNAPSPASRVGMKNRRWDQRQFHHSSVPR